MYCLMKKSESAAMDMNASEGMLDMLSNPKPKLLIRIRKKIRTIERII